jgi:hypothetical protein
MIETKDHICHCGLFPMKFWTSENFGMGVFLEPFASDNASQTKFKGLIFNEQIVL